jgi:hypothetical protein
MNPFFVRPRVHVGDNTEPIVLSLNGLSLNQIFGSDPVSAAGQRPPAIGPPREIRFRHDSISRTLGGSEALWAVAIFPGTIGLGPAIADVAAKVFYNRWLRRDAKAAELSPEHQNAQGGRR